MVKIGYALYYHVYNKVWESKPEPFYKEFYFENGKSDMEERVPNYESIPDYPYFEGTNQSVFKYQYFEGTVNGQPNCIFKLIFYEGFEVVIIPAASLA